MREREDPYARDEHPSSTRADLRGWSPPRWYSLKAVSPVPGRCALNVCAAKLLGTGREPIGRTSVSVAPSRSMASSCHWARIWEAFRGGMAHSRAVPVAPRCDGAADDVLCGHRIVATWQLQARPCKPIPIAPTWRQGGSVGDRAVDLVSNGPGASLQCRCNGRSQTGGSPCHGQQRAPRAQSTSDTPGGLRRGVLRGLCRALSARWRRHAPRRPMPGRKRPVRGRSVGKPRHARVPDRAPRPGGPGSASTPSAART